jgi:hypothetical protein
MLNSAGIVVDNSKPRSQAGKSIEGLGEAVKELVRSYYHAILIKYLEDSDACLIKFPIAVM